MTRQTQMNLFETGSAADFSGCRLYRYTLWRVWDDRENYVQFIGLNPSTADETRDDPTIRRCRNFARDWGFGAMCMTNLFAYRATDPRAMKKAARAVGEANDEWLLRIASGARLIVAAWGNHGVYLGRDRAVKSLLGRELHCFKLTKSNQPEHPLYQPGNRTPVIFAD